MATKQAPTKAKPSTTKPSTTKQAAPTKATKPSTKPSAKTDAFASGDEQHALWRAIVDSIAPDSEHKSLVNKVVHAALQKPSDKVRATKLGKYASTL